MRTAITKWLTLLTIPVTALHCAGVDDVTQNIESRPIENAPGTDAGAMKNVRGSDAGVEPTEQEPKLPAAGWLDSPGLMLLPYCSGVQLDDTRAVTSALCLQHGRTLTFETGMMGGEGAAVADTEALPAAPALAELTFAAPFQEGIELEISEETISELVGRRVRSVSMGFAQRGEPVERWVWGGVLEASPEGELEVVPDHVDGTRQGPSCHGDNGAGVFTEDGALVGLVVRTSGKTELGCAERLVLARPVR